MPQAFGQVDSFAVDVVNQDGIPFAEGRGSDAQVDDDVEECSFDAGDVLGLPGRGVGEVDSAQTSCCGYRAISLRQFEVAACCGGEG